jgi:two-component system response regulator BaeR
VTENPNILLIEDELQIAFLVRDYLHTVGIRVVLATDGLQALQIFTQQKFDLVLLDIELTHVKGTKLCQQIRHISTVPIIMICAHNDEKTRLECLSLEANDFVGKPFSPRTLIAKIQAMLQYRYGQWQTLHQQKAALHSPKPIILDETRYEIHFSSVVVPLTKIEFRLFKTLSEKPGWIYSRNQLMSAMYGDFRVVSERTIDSHIKKLRKKLQKLPSEYCQKDAIESRYGTGYRYRGEHLIIVKSA